MTKFLKLLLMAIPGTTVSAVTLQREEGYVKAASWVFFHFEQQSSLSITQLLTSVAANEMFLDVSVTPD